MLEYFDASLIGLTATPSKQTFGFFQQNLVMEYNHEKAVADGVNVGFDIVRIGREVFGKGNDFCQKITYRTGFVRLVEKKKQADGREVDAITWKRASSLSPRKFSAPSATATIPASPSRWT